MHKSAKIIFLTAPLIMLVSFASMNNFSNAMAFKMNTDTTNEDHSQRYERFYQDDSFREDSYKQLDQQEQQQQSNYNDYAYNDDKKISYSNNDYDNDNRYSSYPTKDKIYECRTGQFEGFFVSSPEFCDLEIPPVSPDVGQLPPENIYLAIGPLNSTDTLDEITSIAACTPGDIAVGGGFIIQSSEGLSDVFQLQSIPPGNLFDFESTENQWLASVLGEDVLIQGIARCFENPS